MVNASADVIVEHSSSDMLVSWTVVGESWSTAMTTLTSIDDVLDYMVMSTWLSPDALQQQLLSIPQEVVSLLDQPWQQEKFTTIIANIAQFFASEKRKPWWRLAYPLENIFTNAQLSDSERISWATTDLLDVWYTQWFSWQEMSEVQQQRLLDVHGMYPEKWVFELDRSEKWWKYQALLSDGVFDTQQAKLLLDRGYAGVLWKFLWGITKIASIGSIIWFILLAWLFFRIGGCEIINWTVDLWKKAVETTKEVAEPVVTTWVDILKFLWWWISHISSGLQARLVELETLKWEKEAVSKRLLDIKQKIKQINDSESFFKFWDSDEEDALQDQEEELEVRLIELDKEIFNAEEAMRKEAASQERFDAPFKSAKDAFTEKRGDVTGWTKEQREEFSEYVSGIWGGDDWQTEEEKKEAIDSMLKKREQQQINEKWYNDDF